MEIDMTQFCNTPEGEAFVGTADSRETSVEIMRAIAFFARDLTEAEVIWADGFGAACSPTDIWEHVTRNGLNDSAEYCWGAAGSNWWPL